MTACVGHFSGRSVEGRKSKMVEVLEMEHFKCGSFGLNDSGAEGWKRKRREASKNDCDDIENVLKI
jgi:hypothetical protein